jgi:hypothetical protein
MQELLSTSRGNAAMSARAIDWTKSVDNEMYRKHIGKKQPSLQDILETLLTKYFDHFEIRGISQYNGTVRVYFEYCLDGEFYFMEREFFTDEILNIRRRDEYMLKAVENYIAEEKQREEVT